MSLITKPRWYSASDERMETRRENERAREREGGVFVFERTYPTKSRWRVDHKDGLSSHIAKGGVFQEVVTNVGSMRRNEMKLGDRFNDGMVFRILGEQPGNKCE